MTWRLVSPAKPSVMMPFEVVADFRPHARDRPPPAAAEARCRDPSGQCLCRGSRTSRSHSCGCRRPGAKVLIVATTRTSPLADWRLRINESSAASSSAVDHVGEVVDRSGQWRRRVLRPEGRARSPPWQEWRMPRGAGRRSLVSPLVYEIRQPLHGREIGG